MYGEGGRVLVYLCMYVRGELSQDQRNGCWDGPACKPATGRVSCGLGRGKIRVRVLPSLPLVPGQIILSDCHVIVPVRWQCGSLLGGRERGMRWPTLPPPCVRRCVPPCVTGVFIRQYHCIFNMDAYAWQD